ncbi:hypothetical protein K435DRAFT_803068 [Dendrothele bispora CBS 962.96]|uniref:Uncharacterized protein n=1 Tax=Dendrothele bispora (strain CBS 962.96) TaxID=1314807 RepID=A0A4S8LJ28_DENBC|nr:hypothetical protein K435DRAFT_803068 [Dendrothele bispora CBS 962.96]
MSLQRRQGSGFRSTARVEHMYIEPGQTLVLHSEQAVELPSLAALQVPSQNTATSQTTTSVITEHATVHAHVHAHETDVPQASTHVCFFRAYARVPTAAELESNLRPSQNFGNLWEIAQHMVSFVFGPVYREFGSLEDALNWYRLSTAETPGPTIVPRCPGAPACPILLHCPPESLDGDFLLAATDTNWTFPAAYPATPRQPPPGYEDRDHNADAVGNHPTLDSSQGPAENQEEEPASPSEPSARAYNISDLASSDEEQYGSEIELTEEDRYILDRIEREASVSSQ